MLKLLELNKYSVMTDDARFVVVWSMHAVVCWIGSWLLVSTCCATALNRPLWGRKHLQHGGCSVYLTVMLSVGHVEGALCFAGNSGRFEAFSHAQALLALSRGLV